MSSGSQEPNFITAYNSVDVPFQIPVEELSHTEALRRTSEYFNRLKSSLELAHYALIEIFREIPEIQPGTNNLYIPKVYNHELWVEEIDRIASVKKEFTRHGQPVIRFSKFPLTPAVLERIEAAHESDAVITNSIFLNPLD